MTLIALIQNNANKAANRQNLSEKKKKNKNGRKDQKRRTEC